MGIKHAKHSEKQREKATGFAHWLAAKKWHLILFVIGVFLTVLYFTGVIFFFNIFMPNTKLSGRDISFETISQVADNLDVRSDNYALDVLGEDFTLTIFSKDISLELNGIGCAQKTIEQTNPWGWPILIFLPHSLELSKEATFDKEAVDKLVDDAVTTFNTKATPPTPAKVTYVSQTRSFEVQNALPGTQLDTDKITQAVSASLAAFKTELILNDSFLLSLESDVESANLAKACLDANAKLSLGAEITSDKKVIETLGPEDLQGWIQINTDGTATFSLDLIKNWVSKTLSPKLNTVGSTRTYTRPDGKIVTVKGGTYGWKANTASIAQALYNDLSNGKTPSVKITYSQTGEQHPNDNGVDFGTTYLDIDLSQQHARLYQNGSLAWESDIISGNPTNGHATPQGIFFINNNFNKSNPASTLRGAIDPATGQPEYESKVSYWMPFSGNSIGLHDASWQSNFGGKTYLSKGSHGCINLPVNKAKELVSLVARGLVVIVHI